MLKKVLTWALVIFVVYFVVTRPGSAAGLVKSAGNGLVALGRGFGDFLSRVVS
jgi:preprotein translocase subunit SecG